MIDVCDLHFTYAHADKAAVRGLEFAVERGEIFGFLGPSGAGKSTTQKVLAPVCLPGRHSPKMHFRPAYNGSPAASRSIPSSRCTTP